MPAGPIGACWEEDSWEDTAWEEDSWGESESEPVTNPDVISFTVRITRTITREVER